MNTFYAVIFVTKDALPYLRRITTHLPNSDPGGLAKELLEEHPHAMSIILIDENFKVVNQYTSPSLA